MNKRLAAALLVLLFFATANPPVFSQKNDRSQDTEKLWRQVATQLSLRPANISHQFILDLVRGHCGSDLDCQHRVYETIRDSLEKVFNLPAAIFVSQEMVSIARQQGNLDWEGKAHRDQFRYNSTLGNLPKSIRAFEKARDCYERAGNRKMVLRCKIDFLETTSQFKPFAEVYSAMDSLVLETEKAKDTSNLLVLHIQLFNLAMENSRHDLAVKHIEITEKLVPFPYDKKLLGLRVRTAAARARMAETEGDFSEAKKQFENALRWSGEAPDRWSEINALVSLAKLNWKMGEKTSAKKHLENAETKALALNLQDFLLQIFELKSVIAEAEGRFADALVAKKKAVFHAAELKNNNQGFNFQAHLLELEKEKLNIEKAKHQAESELKSSQLLASVAILLLLVLLTVGVVRRSRLRQKMEYQETLRLRELDDFKNRFFTNITHEFRTPLTVILGMTGRLTADGGRWTAAEKNGLSLIKRNGENLLRLINQILDLAKLESNTLKINYVQGDVLAFLKYIAESLHSLANAQNLMLRVESEHPKIVMDYDPERLLQIVHNLLSNAIKFTPSGGRVVLRASLEDSGSTDFGNLKNFRNLIISVSDTGVGIPKDELPFLFDRFFQARNQEHAKTGGTGIGLSLTRELVKAMGGEISVESEIGKGTIFTVKLPISNEANFENLTNREIEISKTPILETSNFSKTAISNLPDTAPLLLLIEDNPDVVEYLAACLKNKYRIDFAFNGRAGIEKALEIVPDLIISDVMMPEKDGFEVCDFLKNDGRTSHIPIVLLTAKATVEDRIAGIRRGADAYLAKPFREEELLVWVEKLIAQRRNLQSRYAKMYAEIPAEETAAAPVELVLEDAFIQKFRGVLEANFSDTHFSVDALCQKMAMSRTQIHRKLTALTNRSTTEHINAFRLEKARQLLLAGGLNVSEVAFKVGFNDPKYFSRLFAEAFGHPPTSERSNVGSKTKTKIP